MSLPGTIQYQCYDPNSPDQACFSQSQGMPYLVRGWRLEIFQPFLDKGDLLLVDRLDERGLLARLGQAVLVPVVDTVYGNRFGSATIAL